MGGCLRCLTGMMALWAAYKNNFANAVHKVLTQRFVLDSGLPACRSTRTRR